MARIGEVFRLKFELRKISSVSLAMTPHVASHALDIDMYQRQLSDLQYMQLFELVCDSPIARGEKHL